MSQRGTQVKRETPSFNLAASYTTAGATATVRRYDLMSFTTANDGLIEVTDADQAASRSMVLGVANKPFPETLNVSDPYGNNKNLTPTTVPKEMGVDKGKATWFLVIMENGDGDITINVGDELVPSSVAGRDGGVIPRAASTITATVTEAAVEFELDENRRIIGRAWSRIHIYDATLTSGNNDYDSDSRWLGGGPSLGVNELSAGVAMTAPASGVKIGYVFGELYH